MNRFRSFATGMTACLLLSGCGSIYLHDEGLKTSTGKAHEALAGVAPLKPFDDQLANLDAFAKREDQGVADYWAAVRDAHFSGLLTAGDAALRREMQAYVGNRLAVLIGTGSSDPAMRARIAALPALRDQAIDAKASHESRAASARRRHLEGLARSQPIDQDGDQAEPDLSCATLAGTADDEYRRLRRESPALAELISRCRDIQASEARIAAVTAPLKASDGLLRTVAIELESAETETEEKLSSRAQALEQAIAEAKEFDEENSSGAQLAKFRADLRKLLDRGGAATQLAGWDEADTVVGDLLRAEICDAPEDSVDETTKADAKCDEAEPDSTTGKAQAAWAVITALARLQDSGAEQRRDINWLLAAKAIIAAEKADAELRLREQRARAVGLRQRLDALISETAGLVAAHSWLEERPGRGGGAPRYADCWGAVNTRVRRANPDCAFAAYVDAWNYGRLPAEVLAFRPVQIEREFAVRRARSAAEKQYALALAGTATLKRYGEGGIMPQTVAQLLLDLTAIGAIRVEN